MEEPTIEQEIVQESEDKVGSLSLLPEHPPMRKSDTRDSISSVDSDVSLSFDRRGSKDEEADQSDCASSEETKQEKKSDVKKSDSNKLETSTNNNNNNNNTENENFDENKENVENEAPITVSDDLAEKICDQVEFYFSDENIVKDAFLLKHVKRNKEGYVSLKLISSFKRVKHLSRDWKVVGAALKAKSKKLQVNEQGTKLRRLDPLPQYDQTLPSRTVIAARLPIDKLTIESVAEVFGMCGEIALIRILKPGHPVPAEIRQAIAKKSELSTDEECAVIEFTDSASARTALTLSLGEAKLYELQQTSGEKKRKQQPQTSQNPPNSTTKKSAASRITAARQMYTSTSGSEEDMRSSRASRMSKVHQNPLKVAFSSGTPQAMPYQGPPSPEVWIPRRFSTCMIGTDQMDNALLMRRLSGSSSDTTAYSYPRRFSTCSSGSENGYSSPLFHPGHQQNQNHYQGMNYWPNQASRRYSCCSPPQLNCGSPNGFYSPGRRGSADCGPFIRRLSTCSRDSGYDGNRRLSSCSSSSESCGFRSRSNSGFVVMAHLPENVTRLPSGPDGTRGFGRNTSSAETKPAQATC